jgi:hypothetical protein
MLSDRQAMVNFEKEKLAHRSYNEHLNYLLQVNEAGGGYFSQNVVKSLVHRCGADLVHESSARYDCERFQACN